MWLVLALLTLSYLWIDRSADHDGTFHPLASSSRSWAIVIAVVKVRIIFREFMEVRHAPALLRRLTDLWVVLIAVALIGCYLVGMTI